MNAYTEKSNLLAKQRFYEEMAPNDLSRAFYIHKSGSVIGWRIVRQGGAVLLTTPATAHSLPLMSSRRTRPSISYRMTT